MPTTSSASCWACPAALLAEYGAVSAEVARAMAEGARAATGAEVGIAVTGVAGPGGGSERKPVGLVYLHVSAPGVERGQEHASDRRPRPGARMGDGRRSPAGTHDTFVTARAGAADPAR